jgi:RNA polymerase sigma-70 factor (ECF subfamily)
MTNEDWLAERFQDHRAHLRAVAFRMLGSASEAEDAVQEAWIRLSRSDTEQVDNLGGWLTTVVARVSLDMLRSRTSRREEPLERPGPYGSRAPAEPPGPEQEVLLADAVGPALLVVLDTLSPAERLAFVLHDLFAVPFEEIAPIVGRTPVAARQLASRARRRVRGAGPGAAADRGRQREVVEAFLAASRSGEFGRLLGLLDPDVVLQADAAVVRMGAVAEVRGPQAVAETFSGRARHARLALLDGVPGAAWQVGGKTQVAFEFDVIDGLITQITLVADRETLDKLVVEFPGNLLRST